MFARGCFFFRTGLLCRSSYIRAAHYDLWGCRGYGEYLEVCNQLSFRRVARGLVLST